ncbi:dihydropteridine reductase [Vibrio coralliilyticus]|uniref:Flavohemoprotein n=1 Tax=Vibrio coralliilyticus TaxID=190893 RepID=A0A7Y4GH89_9VIBR|nr:MULTISPECIES: NO-inducible flavohemoprotein [Vibrio]AIW21830.1 dihydropteridine reductase [Vibrio coralliilyticus]AXN33515.1 NO-inducible flavohemoprotein [Vibrio coralliilyticus]EEX33084.1 flavohemoprotein [Vibrio coralliilyticus ATCC BAA-450]KJY72164.1 dihydropteridine reductase [Vibrio coralliilyticus]KPH23372.1 dihydropteridine reductase [Vibrio coralliilyticus]
MLNNQHIEVVKSTIPLLESAGPALTQHFYQRMFSHNPELKDIFNMTHQKTGRQSVALFEAVAAYAKNIENLEALTSAVERIAHKHTSFNIQAEHYQIVGHHLIETLRELASEAFTKEVEEAWTAAYLFLAKVFIDREGELYLQRKQAIGGWENARQFVVKQKQPESEYVTSFVLEPKDGGDVLDYNPGQYVGVEVKPSAGEHNEIRQYSLSQKPNGKNYRISVKREVGEHNGLVSNFMHDEVNEGDTVHLYAPAGDFYYQEKDAPVVLISAGVGATPIQSMLQTLAAADKKDVSYLYACNSADQHTFKSETEQLISQRGWQQFTWYLNDQAHFEGQMNLSLVERELPLSSADFYLCGPVAFMEAVVKQLEGLGVTRDRIHYEVFGPHTYL